MKNPKTAIALGALFFAAWLLLGAGYFTRNLAGEDNASVAEAVLFGLMVSCGLMFGLSTLLKGLRARKKEKQAK